MANKVKYTNPLEVPFNALTSSGSPIHFVGGDVYYSEDAKEQEYLQYFVDKGRIKMQPVTVSAQGAAKK